MAPAIRICKPVLQSLLLALSLGTLASTAEATALSAATSDLRNGLHEYVKGRFAWQNDDIRLAADSYAQALDYDPGDPLLLRQSFELALAGGAYDRALTAAQAIEQADSDNSAARLFLASADLREGRLEAASARLAGLPDAGVEAVVRTIGQAWILAAQGQPNAALALLTAEPGGTIAYLYEREHAAHLLAFAGKTDEALSAYRALLLGEGGRSIRLRIAAATTALRAGKRFEAETLLDVAGHRELDPRVSALLQDIKRGVVPKAYHATAAQGVSELLYTVAADVAQERANPLALMFARLAGLLAPERADTHILTADLLRQTGNVSAALIELEQIGTGEASWLRAQVAKAAILTAAERTPEALTLLQGLTQKHPERASLWIELGDLHRRLEQYELAASAYSQGVNRLGKPQPADWALYYLRGASLERLGQWPAAEADLRLALSLRPDEPDVLNYLGYSLLEQRRNLGEAVSLITKAAEARPTDGYIADSLGWANFITGHYETAVATLEGALDNIPGDPTVNEHLGDAYWQVGRHLEARFRWRAALDSFPAEAQRTRLQTKLDEGLVAGDSNGARAEVRLGGQ